MTRKGYVLLEVIASTLCVMILLLPILKTIDMIRADELAYEENKMLIKTMDKAKENIDDAISDADVEKSYKIDDYNVDVENVEQIYDNVSKYKVVIEKDNTKKTEFYIYKRY